MHTCSHTPPHTPSSRHSRISWPYFLRWLCTCNVYIARACVDYATSRKWSCTDTCLVCSYVYTFRYHCVSSSVVSLAKGLASGECVEAHVWGLAVIDEWQNNPIGRQFRRHVGYYFSAFSSHSSRSFELGLFWKRPDNGLVYIIVGLLKPYAVNSYAGLCTQRLHTVRQCFVVTLVILTYDVQIPTLSMRGVPRCFLAMHIHIHVAVGDWGISDERLVWNPVFN